MEFILNKFSDSELPSVKVAFDFLLQESPGAATCWSEERQLEQELQEAGVRGKSMAQIFAAIFVDGIKVNYGIILS